MPCIEAVVLRCHVLVDQTHMSSCPHAWCACRLGVLCVEQVRMQEPSSLIDLSSALGLDSTTIGDAHCAAAEEVRGHTKKILLPREGLQSCVKLHTYDIVHNGSKGRAQALYGSCGCPRLTCVLAVVCVCQIAKRLMEVPMDEQEDAWEQKMINKLLFLSNRVFSQLEEEETREYELGRLEEILGLSGKEGSARIKGLVFPFYSGILSSGITALRTGKGKGMDAEGLGQWRKSLGVADAQAAKLHASAFAEQVKTCVDAGNGRLTDTHMDVLDGVSAHNIISAARGV